jgi:hypothetical protein
MTTLWHMPLSEIEKKRDALQAELNVHKDNDITLLESWDTIEEAYQGNIDRYQTEINNREKELYGEMDGSGCMDEDTINLF